MKLRGKKVAMMVSNEFEDIELWYPMIRLSEEGAWITIATLHLGFHPRPYVEGKPITGRFGTTVPPLVHRVGKLFDIKNIAELVPEEYDGVIIPGGFSPDFLRRDPVTLEFLRRMAGQGKMIASICHGSWVMISAGIVKGKKMTAFFAIKDDLVNAGALFVDEPVAVDGKIVTSRCPDDLPDFCRAIITAMSPE
ncbi:MAG: type 1 glutamine amidotransferase [Deltaproteobacteria bacterium]|nr:type 1 glutamine amidotransferase [Deltaproteobacteria bacterium]